MVISPAMYLNALFLLLGDNSERSRSLVKEFLESADKHASKNELMNDSDDLIAVYRNLIHAVIAENISQENTTASKMLLLKLSSNEIIKSHPIQRDLLTDVLTAQVSVSAEQIDEYIRSLRNVILISEMNDNVKRVYARSRALIDIQDPEKQSFEITHLKAMLNESFKAIELRENSSNAKATENYVSISDPDSIKRSLDKYMERSVSGIIRTGLQGLNRSLGERGGIGRGDAVVFAAPSHHYKSGMLVSWMRWGVEYNTYQVQPGKRPLVYFVSIENEVHENLMFVFKAIYSRIENRKVDLSTLSTEDITAWLRKYFDRFDTDLIIDRYTPHEFSFHTYLKRYNSFVDQGYELVMFVMDYLSEARGIDHGDTMSAQGTQQLIKENYTKFANHGKQNAYSFVTGHQLNRKADELAASKHNAVKLFNPAVVADSSDVFRTVDVFFFLLLQNNIDGLKFLTGVNNKNRGNQDTLDSHKYWAYPFTEFGIQDDLNDLPGFVTDIDAYKSSDTNSETQVSTGALF